MAIFKKEAIWQNDIRWVLKMLSLFCYKDIGWIYLPQPLSLMSQRVSSIHPDLEWTWSSLDNKTRIVQEAIPATVKWPFVTSQEFLIYSIPRDYGELFSNLVVLRKSLPFGIGDNDDVQALIITNPSTSLLAPCRLRSHCASCETSQHFASPLTKSPQIYRMNGATSSTVTTFDTKV